MRIQTRISNRVLNSKDSVVADLKRKMATEREKGKYVIDLGQALVNLPPPKEVFEFLSSSLIEDHKLTTRLCSDIQGRIELREEIAKARNDIFQQQITAENVVVVSGANQGIDFALQTIANPNDSIVIPEPHFFNHEMAAIQAGLEVNTIEIPEDLMISKSLANLFKNGRKVNALMSCPVNPTGQVIPSSQLWKVGDICRKSGGWLILDDTYRIFCKGSSFEESSPRKLDLNSTMVASSFSKSLSLAGWRIGYIVCHQELVPQLLKCQDAKVISASSPGQQVALEALKGRSKHFLSAGQLISERRARFAKMLDESNAFEKGADGVFFCFAKIKKEIDDRELSDILLKKHGIASVPGSAFGSAGSGHIRFALGMPSDEDFSKSLEILKRFSV